MTFTPLDIAIALLLLCMGALGYRQGFVAGALSLIGLVLGAVLATRLGPLLLPEGAASPYAPLFGLVGALGAALLLSTGLQTVGFYIRDRLHMAGGKFVDGLLGALLTGVVALGIAWVVAAVVINMPATRQWRPYVQSSVILRNLNERLPPSGPLLNTIARYDPFPAINGPAITVTAPDPDVPRDPQVRRAASSVVRVTGTACGLGVTGSGWVAAPNLIVTNAHVVAGQSDTVVQLRGEGRKRRARAVVYDSTNDLAILHVDSINARVLPMVTDPATGGSGAVLGFPQNGPFNVQPSRFGRTSTVRTQDAYGNGPVMRKVDSFRALVRSGNSGGPVVDGDGRVQTTVFASTVDATPKGGYGVPNSVVRERLADVSGGTVDTGPCTA